MSRRYKINYLKASLVLSRAERGRGRERGEAKGEGQPHCAYRTRIPFRPEVRTRERIEGLHGQTDETQILLLSTFGRENCLFPAV